MEEIPYSYIVVAGVGIILDLGVEVEVEVVQLDRVVMEGMGALKVLEVLEPGDPLALVAELTGFKGLEVMVALVVVEMEMVNMDTSH